ncbi:hypothetical protein KIN20_008200 [Parelaphostrongylus tenuis]|uniref:Impact N-terminal domain-containing protein n=1 Tax=Parelaphostrongylus tenuis TaxID=148309 RepID=A0AAD5M7M0_PARTN|nr:hypothetical protein KIN20_008200 [Parelaphostrongylus tenuis]
MIENKGSPIIYTWVTMIKNFLENRVMSESQAECSNDGSDHEDERNSRLSAVVPVILHGDVLTDRKSRFQAHVARIQSENEVTLVLERLRENPKIARATHNIYAYRVTECRNGRLVRLEDFVDDGETGASSRMLQLLHKMNVDNVIVVVSRWYGGVHLGTDRFRHITNLTYDILSKLRA